MRRLERRFARSPPAAAPDAELAFALTQLLLDGGHADAVGCIVVATWRCEGQVAFEVICPEPARIPVAQVLARTLARPFHHVGAWLLSHAEALQIVGRVKGEGVKSGG